MPPHCKRCGVAPQEAAELLRDRAQAAHILGDHDAAERLKHLATTVDFEVEYALNVDRGLPIVCRRTDAPKGATVGWYFLHDPVVRAERCRIGAHLPDVEKVSTSEESSPSPSSTSR
jgi:hypothetical protein